MAHDILKLLSRQSLETEKVVDTLKCLTALPVADDGLKRCVIHTRNGSQRLLGGRVDVDKTFVIGLVIRRKFVGDLLQYGLGKTLD